MDITNYRVKKINDYLFLETVIKFLKKGFNQSDLFASKYLDYLLTMNTDCHSNPFGYALLKKEKLEGALLTAFQGNHKESNEKKIKVFNLSCWYVSLESRGIPALFHAKSFVEAYKESIITGYTFGEVGSKVFKRLGFKNMNGFIYRKLKPNLTKFLLYQIKNINEINDSQFDNFVLSREKMNALKEVHNFSINQNYNRTIFFSGVIKKVKIKSFYVKSFFILWASDYLNIYENFDNIHKFLFLNYGVISLYYYCPNYLKNECIIKENYCRDAPFMIKSPLDINYLSPIDSELSLGGY